MKASPLMDAPRFARNVERRIGKCGGNGVRRVITNTFCNALFFPSPGTPGEGQGGGFVGQSTFGPHPNPPPEYQGRGKCFAEPPRRPCQTGGGCEITMPGQMTLAQQLQSGLSRHQAGRLAEAEEIYRQVLAQQPNQADALHLLGVLAKQTGRLDAAVDLIRQAIALKPDLAGAHYNLANALTGNGKT